MKYVLVIVVAAVVLSLFLLPVVPITVVQAAPYGPGGGAIPGSASASPMYAYLGLGAVYVPGSGMGHSYCFMYGNPGTICGYYT